MYLNRFLVFHRSSRVVKAASQITTNSLLASALLPDRLNNHENDLLMLKQCGKVRFGVECIVIIFAKWGQKVSRHQVPTFSLSLIRRSCPTAAGISAVSHEKVGDFSARGKFMQNIWRCRNSL